MKIAYVTTYDARDVNMWSGLGYFIGKSLENAGATVQHVGPLDTTCPPRLLAKRVVNRLRQKQYLWQRSPQIARRHADNIRRHLAGSAYDVILSLDTVPIAYLEEHIPIVTWTDATFASMLDFYPGFNTATVARESLDEGLRLEDAAIQRSHLSIYASEWAATSAIQDLSADSERVEVVPFGANLERIVPEDEIAAAVLARPAGTCKLLFLGKTWGRKGGPMALAVTAALNDAGLATELTIVGCEPTVPERLRQFVKVLGYVDKAAGGNERIGTLLSASHFLILPTQAECYGLALCEANAYGVPCLTTNVGGVPTIVRSGVNGMMFGPDDPVEAYATCVADLIEDFAAYRDLAMTSYHEYRTRLNWTVAGTRVKNLLEAL